MAGKAPKAPKALPGFLQNRKWRRPPLWRLCLPKIGRDDPESCSPMFSGDTYLYCATYDDIKIVQISR
jgi:hypothetical protein